MTREKHLSWSGKVNDSDLMMLLPPLDGRQFRVRCQPNLFDFFIYLFSLLWFLFLFFSLFLYFLFFLYILSLGSRSRCNEIPKMLSLKIAVLVCSILSQRLSVTRSWNPDADWWAICYLALDWLKLTSASYYKSYLRLESHLDL